MWDKVPVASTLPVSTRKSTVQGCRSAKEAPTTSNKGVIRGKVAEYTVLIELVGRHRKCGDRVLFLSEAGWLSHGVGFVIMAQGGLVAYALH